MGLLLFQGEKRGIESRGAVYWKALSLVLRWNRTLFSIQKAKKRACSKG